MKLPPILQALLSTSAAAESRSAASSPQGFPGSLRFLAFSVLLGLLVGCGGGPGSSTTTPAAASASGQPTSANVTFREGDMAKITFDASTNLNAVVKVQLDGTITMPLIGELKAAGKTAADLRADLMKSYSTLLKGEEITVSLASTTSSVYISGAVLRPGRFPMDRPLTVMDAVMEAGGFDLNRAKPSGVTVFRVEDGKQKSYKIDMRKVLNGHQQDLFYLKPFDTIHVPEKTFNF
ncbi:MAG: polysaccharide biosynthesis/export family protein [Verrucomicrobiales bacterium]|nr:polysaccharide biosynthesis/export family protein [Verrucomicrobiales bacterium]